MIDFLKSAEISDNEFLDLLKNGICKAVKFVYVIIRYKRLKSSPVVSFSLAHDFNERVAMDLKIFRNGYIMHLLDHAARFSAAAIIYSKRKEVIIDKLFKHWIALLSTPN